MSGEQRSRTPTDHAAAARGVGRIGFGAVVIAVQITAITLVSVATEVGYHALAYGVPATRDAWVAGALTALGYVVPIAFRDGYRVESYLAGQHRPRRTVLNWNIAFLCLAVIAFLTKTTDGFSRGWGVFFYAGGLGVIVALELAIAIGVRRALASGHVRPRRVMLIGTAADITRFTSELGRFRFGIEIVGSADVPASALRRDAVPSGDLLDPSMRRAVALARSSHAEDVILLGDWSDQEFIDRCFEAFSLLPVAIHLDAGPVLSRFGAVKISRVGEAAVCSLTEPPLSPMQRMMKRSFDLVVASIALVLLSPLFLVIAIKIKRDSAGPVFFRQRRLGFNQREFLIWKFRSMTTMDDGDKIVQARKGDARITKVGAVLRRYNLDELPQLINVVRGEMSLVGPRPHAVAHDLEYERRILLYPRRLNVQPGITGWAQIHGLRGETDTEDKMRRRVDADLYYVDNWSLWLDLYIIVMTVISPRAYRNAV